MSFELDTLGADAIDARARADGVPFGTPAAAGPGFFDGSAAVPFKGLARGLVAKPALLLGDAATPLLRPVARAVDQALGGSAVGDWLAGEQRKNRQALDDLRPDPLTTGFAGQVLGGLFDLGSSAILYTPEGAATLEGYARREELRGQGVDEGTATAVGAVSGAATLAGIKAPVTLGQAAVGAGAATLARNMAYGAGVNVTAGVLDRGTSREILERAGYAEQARVLDPFDQQAMLAEGVLGSLFSGGAAALQLRNSTASQRATDAALAVRAARHGSVDVAPGVAVDGRSLAAHRSAFDQAAGQLMGNEPVNVGSVVDEASFLRPVSVARTEAPLALSEHLLGGPEQVPFVVPPGAPRGVRNHNPGNLVEGGTPWVGQTGTDGRFAKFDSPEAGIRALARNLLAYRERHGLDTVAGIVGRWAPAVENDTAAYVRTVARELGVKPDQRLDLRDADVLTRLSAAIIRHENGMQPYPADTLRAGVDAALGGRGAAVVTERGMRVPVRYQVRELSELVVSHDDALQPNPLFPPELQPRDRSRDASQAQVARISQSLEPELLAESARASDGAPIIGPDGIVESGNGRVLALAQAYGGERGAAYRQWLDANAGRFGLDAQDVRSMQRPVLVRQRTAPVDRAEFSRQANEAPVASMSTTELARADASRLNDLGGLVANDDGSINLARSAGFVQQFLRNAVGPNEMGTIMQADGRLSQAGQQRMRNAVFAKAYGDADVMAMLSESTDGNLRNVLAGLMRAAPEVARLRDLAEAGGRHPVDVSGDVTAAVKTMAALKAQGMSVEQFLGQRSLLDDGLPAAVTNLMAGFGENARSSRRVAEMVRTLVQSVDALGDPRQAGIFGDAVPDAADLTAGATQRMRDVADQAPASDAQGQPGAVSDPTLRAAWEAAAERPGMKVVLDDGTELAAGDVLARIEAEREAAQRDSVAFEAAVNCFLRG